MGTHPIFESDFDCLTDGNLKWMTTYFTYRVASFHLMLRVVLRVNVKRLEYCTWNKKKRSHIKSAGHSVQHQLFNISPEECYPMQSNQCWKLQLMHVQFRYFSFWRIYTRTIGLSN